MVRSWEESHEEIRERSAWTVASKDGEQRGCERRMGIEKEKGGNTVCGVYSSGLT